MRIYLNRQNDLSVFLGYNKHGDEVKPKSNRNKVLAIVLALVVALTLFLQLIKPSSTFQHVDNFFYTTTSYLKNVLIENPINSVGSFFDELTSINEVRRQNDAYRQYLESMEAMAAQIEQVYRDNQELKDLLDLQQTHVEYEYINTTTINREQRSFNQFLMIDRGTVDGVDDKMAVVSSMGVIGIVERANENDSVVKLLTNEDGLNKYSVLIEVDDSTTVNAILERYDAESGTFEVRLLDSSISITENMKVITSGLGNIIPSGLLIGVIDEIEETSATLSVVAHVKPAADFSRLNYLSVIQRGQSNDN